MDRIDSHRLAPRLRAMSYPEFLIDKRVVQRNIAKGIVDSKELDKALSKLPDVQGNAEPMGIEPSRADDDAED